MMTDPTTEAKTEIDKLEQDLAATRKQSQLEKAERETDYELARSLMYNATYRAEILETGARESAAMAHALRQLPKDASYRDCLIAQYETRASFEAEEAKRVADLRDRRQAMVDTRLQSDVPGISSAWLLATGGGLALSWLWKGAKTKTKDGETVIGTVIEGTATADVHEPVGSGG